MQQEAYSQIANMHAGIGVKLHRRHIQYFWDWSWLSELGMKIEETTDKLDAQ